MTSGYKKAFWVNPRPIAQNPEKHVREIVEMGADEIFLLSIDGDGALYPAKLSVVSKGAALRSLIGDVIKEAKRNGLRVHAWVVALNKPNDELAAKKKDWFVVSRNGRSCVDSPPYVDSYKWLCPSNDEAKSYLIGTIQELIATYDLDGVHLDYIRLPDLFLPEGLRERYGLERERDVYREEFDFCYCERCRSGFRRDFGIDPLEVEYGSRKWYEWHSWRAERITEIVKSVHRTVKTYDNTMETSAAVFATPGYAYRIVFQKWCEWPLDSFEPMIYHEYYGENIKWIGKAVMEGVSYGKMVAAGIQFEFLRSREDVEEAVNVAMDKGASGVCFFLYPLQHPELKDAVREAFSKF
jgi:uncharacterized lipoprotein YddW (UPF0748 family)